ncbi:Protein elav [Psilocybe cubensis]|uniref:Protein elav n=1 Tax=Psilocybe cubensis TaxID=181762 RepID=A0ACB8GTD1_PSICU|nr:Protein elav [Psilocybe cubensis]KAH9478687.1 Protein elav [Psilocybe cubensis]
MQSTKHRLERGNLGSNLHAQPSGKSCTADSGALFDFNTRPTNSISVENIPSHVNRREVVSLFNSLIGEVRSFQDIRDSPSSRLEITFFGRDSATKALCMNGYKLAGVPLAVSALTTANSVNRMNKTTMDDRRNLYVLGLPFALTKNEFSALFAQYGTVSHCVILATVDNSSRRRGFVVMSTHEEAKRAMLALTHTSIKGHSIDVSWAVVQRSQGFLDGGDRALLLDSRSHLSSPSPKLHERGNRNSSDFPDSAAESSDVDHNSVTPVSMPTPSLLVSNIPTLLFSQAQDLQPLFLPFGHIEKLEIVHVSPAGTMSVLVQYSRASVAQEAKDSLSGQLYGNHCLEVRYVKPPASSVLQSDQFLAALSDVLDKKTTMGYSSDPSSRGHLARAHSFGGTTTNQDVSTFKHAPLGGCGNFPRVQFSPMAHTRHTSLTAITPPFSNVCDDFNDPPFTSGPRCAATPGSKDVNPLALTAEFFVDSKA